MPTAQEQSYEDVGVGLKAQAALAGNKAQLAIELFGQGNYQKASDLLSEALEDCETADLWNDWAAAEAACGHTDRAEEGFRRALALEPGNSQAIVNLGVLLAGAGRVQEAIPLLKQAAFRVDEPQRPTVTQLLASCCRKAASDAHREAQATLQSIVAGWRQSSSLLQPAPAATAAALPPSAGPPQRLLTLEKYVVAQGPKALTLESSSVCNLRCVMCPQGRGLVHRPKHFETRLVEKLRPALGDVEFVQLHGIGEPLLSPAFWYFLELLDAREGAHIEVNSNMTVISDEQIGKILRSRLGVITVSLDAATAETYARIRGYDFNKVIRNIKRVLARRNAAGRDKPAIFLNMTLMRANIEEVEAFVELGHSLGVQGLSLWHLNAGEDYRLTKGDGWTFDYREQMLSNYPQLSNEKIHAAAALAERLGTSFKLNPSKKLFFEEARCD